MKINVYTLVFSVTIVSILSSCRQSSDKTPVSHELYTLQQSHTVRFPMDNETSYRTFFTKSFIDSSQNELLVFLAQDKPSIQFFDIGTQSLYKEIKLTKEGPEGIGSPAGLLVLSLDSIFVVSSPQYRVSLINGDGKVLKSYRLLEGENYNENTGMLRPYTTSPPVHYKNKIFFNVAPDRDVYRPDYYDGLTNLKLEISDGKFSYFNNYPKEFRNGVWGVAAVSYSTTFNPSLKRFIYSFAISDSLNVFDPETNQTQRYFARSKFIDSETRPMPEAENSRDLEYALQTPYYNGIVYDKYRDVYYRFVRHSIPYKDDNGEINSFHEKPISIIVLDRDFNIVGETELPNGYFLDYVYFITKDGLFISNGNPENPELEENFAVFTCFKLNPLAK